MSFSGTIGTVGVEALGWTLLHFVWQGAVAAALLALAEALVTRRSAGLRYALASATLTAMMALPVVTFIVLVNGSQGTVAAFAGKERLVPEQAMPARTAAIGMVASAAQRVVAPRVQERLAAALPALVAVWALGVALLSARVFGGWALAQRLRRSGRPTAVAGLEEALARLSRTMRVSRAVRLYESLRVEVPTVIGWMRPVILFPAATLAGLTPSQLETVLAHELAHVRRLDYLVNLLQTAVETLLFYHPAVWWVSHRIRVEREHCCDDAAVAACGDAVSYARALTELEGLRVARPGLAMAADAGCLLHRIGRLLGRPPAHVPRASRALAGLLAVAAVAVVPAATASLDAHGRSGAQPARAGASPSRNEAAADKAQEPAPRPGRQENAEPVRDRKTATSAPALTIENVLELARAGVTPEYLDEMAAAGYRSLTWQQLIELRTNGVGPDYVRGLAAEGYSGLSPDRLVALRSQGVGPEFMRGLKEQGLDKLSLSDLIELRSQGVGPEFIRDLKSVGYANLSTSDLVTLRSQGVSGAYVRELKALGYEGLSVTKLVGLRSQGITPEYVRGLKALGYADLSVPMLIGLRSQGVTPEFVRGLKDAGYAGLPAGMLMELRSQGVTPEFVRELKQAGYSGLTPEELIELRSHGVGGELLRRLRPEARPEPRPEERP